MEDKPVRVMIEKKQAKKWRDVNGFYQIYPRSFKDSNGVLRRRFQRRFLVTGRGQLRMKRHGLQGLLVLAIVLLTAFLAAPQAWADESAPINHWNVDVNLSLDGVAQIGRAHV